MKQRAPIYRQIWELFRQDGHIRPGTGMISGVIALFLAILAVLGVLAFHFPAYLTTPELRAYSVDAMRALLFGALLVRAPSRWPISFSAASAGSTSPPSPWYAAPWPPAAAASW